MKRLFCKLIKWLWNITSYQQINYEWEQVFTNLINDEEPTWDQIQTMARAWEGYFNNNDVFVRPPLASEYWTTQEAVCELLNELHPRERTALIVSLMDDLVTEVYNDMVVESEK